MTYIALDIGRDKTGIAISDETETIATPLRVIKTKDILNEIQKIYESRESIGGIVIGVSKEENPIMRLIKKIEKNLSKKGYKTFLEEEDFSTFEANSITKADDSNAAAIILQRFLEKL